MKPRRMRWAGHVARMGEERRGYRLLVGKTEGKRPLGRLFRKCVDKIKVCLRGDLILLAQDRDKWRAVVSAAINFLVP
jgi:hypothetical protein